MNNLPLGMIAAGAAHRASGVAILALAVTVSAVCVAPAHALVPDHGDPAEPAVLRSGILNPVSGDVIEHEASGPGRAPTGEMQVPPTHRFGEYEVSHFVASEIVRAARDTGVPADVLMAIAEKESSFDVDARPPKGSAFGLMQFIEQTWLQSVARFGAKHGLAAEAAAIEQRDVDGAREYYVEDEEELERILQLRRQPYLATALAARNLLAARERIETRLDNKVEVSDADLYLPHFLGTGGATRLLEGCEESPEKSAIKMFPKAARYNAALFRDAKGEALTAAGLHRRLRGLIEKRRTKYQPARYRPGVVQIVQRAEFRPPQERAVAAAMPMPVAGLAGT